MELWTGVLAVLEARCCQGWGTPLTRLPGFLDAKTVLGLVLSGWHFHLIRVNQDSPLSPNLWASLAQNSVRTVAKQRNPGKMLSTGRASSASSLEVSLMLHGSRRSAEYPSLNISAIGWSICFWAKSHLPTCLKDNVIFFFTAPAKCFLDFLLPTLLCLSCQPSSRPDWPCSSTS